MALDMRERKVDEKGHPLPDPFCRRCGETGEAMNRLCTACKMHYRHKYGVMVAVSVKGAAKIHARLWPEPAANY